MGSTAATWQERRYTTETLTGRIGMTSERMSSRATRWGDDEYLPHTYSVIERWAIRAVARHDSVRTGAVLVRDASEEPDWFIRNLMGVRWTVKAVRGPIPGLRPGQFVPLADGVRELVVPVLKGAEGWAQGRIDHLSLFDPGYLDVVPAVELDRELARRVAKRAHHDHGDWPIGECAEPDCIAMVEALK